jgi:hypothetical protein
MVEKNLREAVSKEVVAKIKQARKTRVKKTAKQNGEIKLNYPAVVSYSATATITYNYQSFKIQVGLSMPVYDVNSLDETYNKLVEFVEKRLNEKVGEVRYLTEGGEQREVL